METCGTPLWGKSRIIIGKLKISEKTCSQETCLVEFRSKEHILIIIGATEKSLTE